MVYAVKLSLLYRYKLMRFNIFRIPLTSKMNKMKRVLCIGAILIGTQIAFGQEVEQTTDSVLIAQQKLEKQKEELKATKQAQKKVDKAEKAQKKAEKAKKKAEKEIKKKEKLAKAIASKKKGIAKNESKIKKLQNKLAKAKQKGKMSSVDEMEINHKINKLELAIVKDKEKLDKLVKKQ